MPFDTQISIYTFISQFSNNFHRKISENILHQVVFQHFTNMVPEYFSFAFIFIELNVHFDYSVHLTKVCVKLSLKQWTILLMSKIWKGFCNCHMIITCNMPQLRVRKIFILVKVIQNIKTTFRIEIAFLFLKMIRNIRQHFRSFKMILQYFDI